MSALYSCLKGKNDTIMAANPPEGTVFVEAEGTPEECSGKKKSKFQAFKKLFVKKKKKEPPTPSRESNLKPSQSSSDVSVSGAKESVLHPAHESVPKSNLGNKAVSHDSVFVSEMENSTKEDTSQENTPGKVKALQLQLQQNIRIGSPPRGIVHKKLEDSGTLSEDDGLPRSPPEITSLHDILAQSSSKNFSTGQRRNSLSLGGTDSEDEPESTESSSLPISPRNASVHLSPTSQVNLCSLVDFATPPSSVVCLDNSAAKHKIAIKPKKRRGLGMNGNSIKQKEEEPLIKETEKKDNEVGCMDEASIPHSEESILKKEAPDKQVTSIEDAEVQVDAGVSLSPHEEDSPDEATFIVHDTSLPAKLIVELHTEEGESEVDFHRSSLAMEDQVNGTEETGTEKESAPLPQISEPIPPCDQEEITDLSDCVEIHYTKTEIHLEGGEELDCEMSDEFLKIEENISVCETNETFENGYKESNRMSPNFTELKDDLLDISTEMLKTESSSANVKAIDDVHNVDSKSSIEAENALNAENLLLSSDKLKMPNTPSSNEKVDHVDLPEPSLSNPVTDEPGIPNTPSSSQKVDKLDLPKSSLSNPVTDKPGIPNTPSSNQKVDTLDLPKLSLSNTVTNKPGILNTPSSNQKVDKLDLSELSLSIPVTDEPRIPITPSSIQKVDKLDLSKPSLSSPVTNEHGIPNTILSNQKVNKLDLPQSSLSKPVTEKPRIPNTPSSNQKVDKLDLPASSLSKPVTDKPGIPNTPSSNQKVDKLDLPESSILNPMTDDPRIPKTPPSNQKVDMFDLKIKSSPNISVDSGVKSSSAFIDLVSSRIHSSGIDALSTKGPSSETNKIIKSPQENVDGKMTTSNKPVRFTVAPAWQRSFSVGSSAKESNSNDKVTSATRSESFDGSEKPRVEVSQSNATFESGKEDSSAAFGVRLRRTSSSRKYSEEYPEEQIKQGPSSADTVEAVSARDVQITPKTLHVRSDSTKLSKPTYHGEDKLWQKKISEDPSPKEKSEPAWITMAKQKRKGFQEHPLSRVTGVTSESDKYQESEESSQKKDTISSPQELEVKRIESTSAISPVAHEDTLPDSGKNTKSAPPQNSEEPPWFSLAKKKAKAWSEMPPIVQ